MIIDEFNHDIPTLRNCALVCRTWARKAGTHLFAHMTFSDRQHSRRIFDKSMCSDKSTIPPHVRSLSLNFFRWPRGPPGGKWMERLRDLGRLRELSVHDLEWAALNPKVKARLSSLVRHAKVINIRWGRRITHIEYADVLEWVAHATNLETLRIEPRGPYGGQMPSSIVNSKSPSSVLQILVISAFLFRANPEWFGGCAIHTLKLQVNRGDKLTPDVLSRFNSSLKHISLEILDSVYGSNPTVESKCYDRSNSPFVNNNNLRFQHRQPISANIYHSDLSPTSPTAL